MFKGASAFDQDLGWCVADGTFDYFNDGVDIQDTLDGTLCASTSCGIIQGNCPTPRPTPAPVAPGALGTDSAFKSQFTSLSAFIGVALLVLL